MSVWRVPPGSVLLTGESLSVARDAVEIAQRWRSRNGLGASSAFAALAQALSAVGQSDMPERPTEDAEVMTTGEAARVLDCSPRQIRRLAPRLEGRRVGGRWLLDTRAVREHHDGLKESK